MAGDYGRLAALLGTARRQNPGGVLAFDCGDTIHVGQRIQELFVQGERVQGDRLYDVAFVTSQGVPAKYGTDRHNLDTRAIEAMRRYLENAGPIDAGLRGAVVAV